jgi:DNA-binding response OmpR family regulator
MKAMVGERPRVVVVDDERHIREMLTIGLEREGFDVKAAADGVEALAVVRESEPDVIILDVMLPKIDGVALLPMLRRLTEAPIVMLSAKGETTDKVEGLTHGADDYVSKPFEMSELVARLQSALRRPKLAQPTVLRCADLTVELESRTVERGGKKIDLSAREYDLLTTLLRHPRRVFSRDQLLNLVWGTEREVGPGTVDTYISYVRAKIDNDFDKKLIHTVRGVGYTLRED